MDNGTPVQIDNSSGSELKVAHNVMGVEDGVNINKPCVVVMEQTGQLVVGAQVNIVHADNDVINPVVEAPRSGPNEELFGIQSSERTGALCAWVCGEYEPINYESELLDFEPYVWNCHIIHSVSVQLNPSAWLRELSYENDAYLKSYLRNGILNGFDIVDCVQNIPSYDSANYRSVTLGAAYKFVDSLIHDEIKAQKYI